MCSNTENYQGKKVYNETWLNEENTVTNNKYYYEITVDNFKQYTDTEVSAQEGNYCELWSQLLDQITKS